MDNDEMSLGSSCVGEDRHEDDGEMDKAALLKEEDEIRSCSAGCVTKEKLAGTR